MSCLAVKNFSENIKVLGALNPKTCPPVNKLRSSIYHPDARTVDRYSCMKNPQFIPTDEILKTIKCKPDLPLYNMPRKGGPCGLKILNNDRRTNCCENYFSCNTSKKCPPNYPHRDVKKLHENLRDPGCDPCGLGIRPLLICRQCGCTYRAKKPSLSQRPRPCRVSPNSCSSSEGPVLVRMNCTRPSKPDNAIYFHVDVLPSPPTQNCSETEIESPKKKCFCSTCRSSSGSIDIRIGDHYPDCQCQLCKKRKDNCPNRQSESEFLNECSSEFNNSNNSSPPQEQITEGNPEWSNPVWFKCTNPSCDCQSGSNSSTNFETPSSNSSPAETAFNMDLTRIQSETCQKVVIRGKDGNPTAVPCHFCFVVDNSQGSSQSNMGMGGDCQQLSTNNDELSFQCGPDTALIPICGVGIGVNKNCKKLRNPVCGCFHCESIAKHKKALHGPACSCLMCDKLREHSSKRPHYYNSLRTKGCSSENSCNQLNQVNCPQPRSSCVQNYTASPQQWSQADTASDPCKTKPKSNIEMVCPCHQFIPTNWERKANCSGCPSTRNMTKIPRASCYKRPGACPPRDREIGAFCPPVLIRALTKSPKCCDNFQDKSVPNGEQEQGKSCPSVVSMGANCKA